MSVLRTRSFVEIIKKMADISVALITNRIKIEFQTLTSNGFWNHIYNSQENLFLDCKKIMLYFQRFWVQKFQTLKICKVQKIWKFQIYRVQNYPNPLICRVQKKILHPYLFWRNNTQRFFVISVLILFIQHFLIFFFAFLIYYAHTFFYFFVSSIFLFFHSFIFSFILFINVLIYSIH